MIKRFAFIISVVSILTTAATAQRKPAPEKTLTKDEIADIKKQAGDAFKGKKYFDAVALYQKLVKAESQNTEINYRLGFSMLNSNSDKTKAVDYLEFASQQKDVPKDVQYWLGIANLDAGAYEAAISAFDKYKAGKPDVKLNVELATEWAYNAKEITKTPLEVTFTNLGKGVNSPFADYRPVVSVDDSVVFFSSNRKGNVGNLQDENGENYTDIWFFTQGDSTKGKAKNPGLVLNSDGYDEACGMSLSADQLLIWRWGQEVNSDIMKSELKGKTWQKPVTLGKTFETKDAESGACLSPDGKTMIFSSDKKGGSGEKDLYAANMNDNGSWNVPQNLGTAINTKYDEDYPSMSADGKTMFFASKGHKSIGGYDIFMTTRPDENSTWSEPVNVGFPLNTPDDNTGFALLPDGVTGYVSAVMADGFGNTDLYKFKLSKALVESNLTVVKANVIVGGTNSPSKNARVTITKKGTGTMMGEVLTNTSTGGFIIALPVGEYDIAIRTEKMGKFDDTLVVPEATPKMIKTFVLQL